MLFSLRLFQLVVLIVTVERGGTSECYRCAIVSVFAIVDIVATVVSGMFFDMWLAAWSMFFFTCAPDIDGYCHYHDYVALVADTL